MRTVMGAGCWPGRAEGPVIWVDPVQQGAPGTSADRAAEVLRFRAEVARAVTDLEEWSELQQTLEGRLLLQGYREALLTDVWTLRVCALIDTEGLFAGAAAVEAARQVGGVMARSESLRERAEQIGAVAAWLSRRMTPVALPPDAILAAVDLPPLALLDRHQAAMLAGPEPAVIGRAPLVWGVPGLGPSWVGRRVAIADAQVTIGIPDPRWWSLQGEKLNGVPVCYLSGDLDDLDRMARKLGRPPAALVRRIEDLAAVPLFAASVAAVAIDLDRIPRLRHPGVRFLLMNAVQAARGAGVPVLAGGAAAAKRPDHWLSLGFTALFGEGQPRGGQHIHAIRRGTESGL